MAKNKKHGRGIDEEEERSTRESGSQSTSDSYSADTSSGSSSYIRDQYNEYKRNPTKFRQNEQTQRYTKTPEYISAAKNYNRSNFEYKQAQRFRDNFYDYYPELKAQDDLQSRLDTVNSVVPNFRNDGFSNRLQQKRAEDIERNWQKYINSGDREAVLKANSDFDETNDVKTKEEKFSEAAQKYQRMMEGEAARGNYGKAIDYAMLAQESQQQEARQSGMSYYGTDEWKDIESNGIDKIRDNLDQIDARFRILQDEIDRTKSEMKDYDDGYTYAQYVEDGTLDEMSIRYQFNADKLPKLEAEMKELQKSLGARRDYLSGIVDKYGNLEYYQSHFGYAPSQDDFSEKSKYIPHEYTVDENNAAFLHELVNGNKEAWKEERNHLGGVSSFLGLSREYINSLSDEEIAVFNYLYETESPERAMSYIKYKQSSLEQRRMDEKLEPYLKFADEHPFWASVASGLASPLKMNSHTGQLLDYMFLSGEVRPNADYNVFSNAINGVRAEVSKDYSNTGRFLYNTGMSMIDSTVSKAFGPYGSLIVMGGSAASDAVIEAKNRGLSDDAAFFTGMLFGGVEAITEKIGVDAWFDAMGSVKSAAKESFSGAFKEVGISTLKSALSEATEEGLADILDCAIDVMINGNKSEMLSKYNKLISEGMSEKDAFMSVFKDQMIELALDSLGGFISGGVMTGGSAIAVNTFYGATSNVRNSAENAKLLGENFSNKENGVADLVKTAAALGVKSNVTAESTNEYRIGKLAENVQEKLQTQFKGVDAATAETVYQNMVSEYGETVKPLVQRAYASEVYGEIKSAKTTQEVAQKVSEITKNADDNSETARIVREVATEKAVQIETQNAKASKVSRRSISEVTIKNENGKAETAQIEKMDKEGQLVLDNGQTVSSDDVDISDSVIEIQSLAKTYDLSSADTAQLFNMTLDHAKSFPSENVYDYFSQLVHAYEQGQGGKYTQQQAAKSFAVKGLLPVDHDLAYSLGRSRFDEASQQRAERLAQLKETAKKNGVTERRGTVDKSALADKNGRIKMNSDRAFAIRLSQAIAETLGVDVKLVEGDSKVEGDYGDRTITLNVEQAHKRPGETVQGAIVRVLSHEVTHSFEKTSETYKELLQFCFDYAAQQIGVDAVEARVRAIQKLYNEAGLDYNRQDAEAEFVAQSCEQMLQNSDMLVELYKRSATLYQRFVDAINELFAKLKKIVSAVNENAKLMQGAEKELQQKWDRCLKEASETIKNTALETSGEVEYSLANAVIPTYEELIEKKPIRIVNIKGGIKSASYADMKKSTLEKAKAESWYDKPHLNNDTNSFIFLTEKSFTHAFSNLSFEFGEDTIRCMAHIPEVIKNAYLVSVADPKDVTKRETKVYSFFGAVNGISGIEPVKLTVKEFNFNSSDSLPQNIRAYFEKNGIMESYNTLYDAKALEVIGIEGVKKESDASVKGSENNPLAQDTSDSVISVADLLAHVNEDAQKYIPKQNNAISNDAAYLSLAEKFRSGTATEAETEQLQKAVEEAAKKAGYDTPILYHGTNSFGFTEFDLSKMDDKRSIFATSSQDVARTYSGATGTRAISEKPLNISQMSDTEVVDALNDYVKRYGDGLESVYSYVAPDAAKNISTDADKAAAELANLVRKKVSQYADKLADDFNDKDYKTHGQLVDLQEKLYLADRQTVLTPLYMLINHTDAFSGSNAETILRSLTLDHEVQKAQQNGLDVSSGFYLRDELGGYMLSPISSEKARATLEGYNRMGNYALVGKTGKSLTVDANGGRWNQFRNSWTKPITDVITLESTFVDELDNYYYLLDKTTGNVLARAEKTDAIAEMSDDSRQIFLMNKAATLIRMETENIRTTREIAAYAKGKGYDSVIFRELIDNGGKSVGIDDAEATSDIYVVFDPAQYKSADLVTYDDNGEIIPLSERFKSDNNDIRYSIAFDDSVSDEELLQQLHMEDAQTKAERNWLKDAQDKAETLKDLRAQLKTAQKQIRAWEQKGNARAFVEEKSKQARGIEDQITKQEKALAKELKNPVLSRLLDVAKSRFSEKQMSLALGWRADDLDLNAVTDEDILRTLSSDGKLTKEGKQLLDKVDIQNDVISRYKRKLDSINKQISNVTNNRETANKASELYGKKSQYERLIAAKQNELNRLMQNKTIQTLVGKERTRLEQVYADKRKAEYEELKKSKGTIEAGEAPARNIAVPKRVTEDTKVSKLARTALEAEITPDSMVPVIEDEILDGMLSYEPQTNKAQISAAEAWIGDRTLDRALGEWSEKISSSRRINTEDVAKGWILYNNLANAANDAESLSERKMLQKYATEVLCGLQKIATESGQLVQAMRLAKKLSPDMQYYALQKSVESLQKELDEGINRDYAKKGKRVEIKVDEELSQNWIQAMRDGDSVAEQTYREALYSSIAKQVPKTFMDKMNAWRYLSMLGNPRTIIRNVVGNIGFMPTKYIKDEIGGVLEAIFVRDKSKRTKTAVPTFFSKGGGKKLMDFARSDFQNVSDIIKGIGKYSDGKNLSSDLKTAINEAKSTFNAPVLKQAQALTGWAMDNDVFGDGGFLKHHYTSSFARAAHARGYTAEQLANGEISSAQIDSLRAYAIREAQKATYRDVNAFSSFVKRLHAKGNGNWAKFANFWIDAVLPFKGTPANVLMRSIEYSPVGLVKTLLVGTYNVANGKISATDFIDQISSGLSGSALYALGFLLSRLGILKAGSDDDDDREGRQGYSLEINGKSITLDWLAPSAIPMFMGASTYEMMHSIKDDVSLFDAISDSASQMLAPMLEMSMLSGVQDLLDTMTYGDTDFGQITYAFFVQPFMSYVSQYIPTFLSQIANATEKQQEFTYVGDAKGQLSKNLTRSLVRMVEKIPGTNWRQQPYVDDWGRTQSKGDVITRFLNSFINPAYVSDIQITDVDTEIRRLEKQTGIEVSPKRRGYTITVSGERIYLSGDQFTKYQTEYGMQYAMSMAAFITSSVYAELSDEDRAKAFDDIEKYVDAYAKERVGVGYSVEDSNVPNIIKGCVKYGLTISEAYAIKLYSDAQEGDGSKARVCKYIYEAIGRDKELFENIYYAIYKNSSEKSFETNRPW